MTLRFFAIPTCDPAAAEAELDYLLAASQVLAVERHFVTNGEASFGAVCVRIASGPGSLAGSAEGRSEKRLPGRSSRGAQRSHPRRVRRLMEQRGQKASLRLPQREAPRQPQRERQPPGVSLCPELDGANGMDLPKTMDQTRRPTGTGCRAGEPQDARGAGRRQRWMPAPTALRVADFAYHPAAR
jgi:hypothetical protein